MANKFHSDVSFDNVREGLVTSADAAAIPFNALAEAVNVEITSVGTIKTRDIVFNYVGDTNDTLGEVLEIHQSAVFDSTGIEDPLACNLANLGKRGTKPKALLGADGQPKLAFLVTRALNAGDSRVDSLLPSMTWKTDLMGGAPLMLKGQYHHNLVDQLGRTYVSNNDTALRYLAITGNATDPTDYNFNYLVGEPTCQSEYEIGTQATTIVTAVPSTVTGTYEGSIVIGQGLVGCDGLFNDLIKYIKDHPPWKWRASYLIQDGNWDANNPPAGEKTNVKGYIEFDDRPSADDLPTDAEIRAKAKAEWSDLEEEKIIYQLTSHTRYDAPGKAEIYFYIQAVDGQCTVPGTDQTEFKITNLTALDPCDRTIMFKENPGTPPNGKFSHIGIKFNDGSEKWYCPTWCCDPNAKLAEGIKGNMLEIDDNRLFISNGEQVNYSASGFYNGWETGNARYFGNFFDKGSYRLGSDAGIVDFPRDGKLISSIVNYENNLYAHRGGNIWKIVLAEGMGNTDAERVPYFDRARINSLGSADFIRAALDGDDFQFWVSSRNSTMVAYGLYPTLTAPSSKVVSFKIDGTVKQMDLTRAALLRWGDLVFLSGKKLDSKDCQETPKPMFPVAPKKVANNWTMVYSKSFDFWFEIDRGFSMFYAGKDGNAYAGGYNGQVWRLDRDGMFDDGIINPDGTVNTDNPTKIATKIKWKSADFGIPNLPKNLMGVWIEGWIGSGDPVEMGMILDQTDIFKVKANVSEMTSQCADACTNLRGRFNSKYFSVYLQLPKDTTFLRLQPYLSREDGCIEIVSVTPILPETSVENDLDVALETGTAVTICLQESKQ